MNLNKVLLIGRLTRDPEVKTTTSGQMVCTFGLATNRNWTNRQTNEKEEQVEFHNIVLWQKLAEIASQYLKKGSLVYLEGRLQTRSWEDDSGTKKYRTEVVVQNLQMAPKGTGTTPNNSPSPEKEEEIPVIDEDDEEIDIKDIPF